GGLAGKAHKEDPDGARLFHHAVTSARETTEGWSRVGSQGDPLARRTWLQGVLDWRASHRTVGATSLARSLSGPSADADEDHRTWTGWLPVALPSSSANR